LNDFGDNASTGRPDELDIAERSGGDEIGNGNWKSMMALAALYPGGCVR
jgi:hypothetical protein